MVGSLRRLLLEDREMGFGRVLCTRGNWREREESLAAPLQVLKYHLIEFLLCIVWYKIDFGGSALMSGLVSLMGNFVSLKLLPTPTSFIHRIPASWFHILIFIFLIMLLTSFFVLAACHQSAKSDPPIACFTMSLISLTERSFSLQILELYGSQNATYTQLLASKSALYVPSLPTRGHLLGGTTVSRNNTVNESRGYVDMLAPSVENRDHRTEISDCTTNALGPMEMAEEEFARNGKMIQETSTFLFLGSVGLAPLSPCGCWRVTLLKLIKFDGRVFRLA